MFAVTSCSSGEGPDESSPTLPPSPSTATTNVAPVTEPASSEGAADRDAGDDEGPTTTVAAAEPEAGSGGSELSAKCEGQADRAGELVMWHSLSNQAAGKLEELIDRYNATEPGPTVRLEQRGGIGELVGDLAATTAEDGPDLVLVDHKASKTLIDSGRALSLRSCAGSAAVVDDLVPIARAKYEYAGDVWAGAFGASVPVLMYNEARVAAAGLDPDDAPSDLPELTDAARAVVDSGAAEFGFVAYDGYGPWFIEHFNARLGQLTALLANGRGGRIEELAIAETRLSDGFDWLVEEVESGRALWIRSNASGFDDILRLVADDGGAAFTISSSAAIGEVLRVLESGSFPGAVLGVSPLPGPGAEGSLLGGNGIWNIDGGDADAAAASAEFIGWLMDAPQVAEFSAYTGYVPTVVGAVDDAELQAEWERKPQLRVSYDQVVDLPADPVWAGPLWGPGDAINTLLYQVLTAMVEDGADPLASLEVVEARAAELLEAYEQQVGS